VRAGSHLSAHLYAPCTVPLLGPMPTQRDTLTVKSVTRGGGPLSGSIYIAVYE
jgi:hypothetical protein